MWAPKTTTAFLYLPSYPLDSTSCNVASYRLLPPSRSQTQLTTYQLLDHLLGCEACLDRCPNQREPTCPISYQTEPQVKGDSRQIG
jgi:hypothetical protein